VTLLNIRQLSKDKGIWRLGLAVCFDSQKQVYKRVVPVRLLLCDTVSAFGCRKLELTDPDLKWIRGETETKGFVHVSEVSGFRLDLTHKKKYFGISIQYSKVGKTKERFFWSKDAGDIQVIRIFISSENHVDTFFCSFQLLQSVLQLWKRSNSGRIAPSSRTDLRGARSANISASAHHRSSHRVS
jgi:hypothetical protein